MEDFKFMIELPLQMDFDLNFINKNPDNNVLNVIYSEISNILPKPGVRIFTHTLNNDIVNFLDKLYLNENHCKIIIQNPVAADNFKEISKKFELNINITDENYNFDLLNDYIYNLIIPVNISINLYRYIKNINSKNITKITIEHNNKNVEYEKLKQEINLLKKDTLISSKCFLIPYLEENEAEKYYLNNKAVRPFLTCSALWLSPEIDNEGKINMPCCNTGMSVLDFDFFEIWNSSEINNKREILQLKKQFNICKHCKKFYENNFLIVEDTILEYKNHKLIFENILNPVKSAPIIGIIQENNICMPTPIYSEEELKDISSSGLNLTVILK